MMPDEIDEFARLFTGFLQRMQELAPGISRESLRDRLRDHLGVEPEQVPVVASSFPSYDLPNVQLAVEAWFDEYDVIGLVGSTRGHHSLGELPSTTCSAGRSCRSRGTSSARGSGRSGCIRGRGSRGRTSYCRRECSSGSSAR